MQPIDKATGRTHIKMPERLVAVLKKAGGEARLSAIYEEVEKAGRPLRLRRSPKLEASVRRALLENCGRGHRLFRHVTLDVWGLTEGSEPLGVFAI